MSIWWEFIRICSHQQNWEEIFPHFLYNERKMDGWGLTMPKRWTDCHTRHALILMVVSTFLVKKHLNIYVWQAKREALFMLVLRKESKWKKSPVQQQQPQQIVRWLATEREINKKVINTYKCKWIQEEMCSSCYLRADLSSGFPVVCL